MKSIFTSLTFWMAFAQAVAGLITVAVSDNPGLETVGWLMQVKTILDWIVRLKTKTAVYVK